MLISFDELEQLCSISGGKWKVDSVDEAYIFCKKVARSHYENFPVASLLIPKKYQKHIFAIYAFARIADDIADEITKYENVDKALILLDKYENLLLEETQNPIFIAINDTINRFDISVDILRRLLYAFRSDILFQQPTTWNDLLVYANNSANPIGELLLIIFRDINDTNLHYSNQICTALQLINFWQDISIDLKRNRCYIPKEFLPDSIENLNDNDWENILQQLIQRTRYLMSYGSKLIKLVKNRQFKLELKLIVWGGNRILDRVEKTGVTILIERVEIF